MEDLNDLYTKFVVNFYEIENLYKDLDNKQDEISQEQFEKMFADEFKLLMDHVSIYEDLNKRIIETPRTDENEFQIAKIKRDLVKMKLFNVVEVPDDIR